MTDYDTDKGYQSEELILDIIRDNIRKVFSSVFNESEIPEVLFNPANRQIREVRINEYIRSINNLCSLIIRILNFGIKLAKLIFKRIIFSIRDFWLLIIIEITMTLYLLNKMVDSFLIWFLSFEHDYPQLIGFSLLV